ncbi:MAG: hypothetical protein MI674_05820 [Cytophagales bacterium]|nr:hypothetical protein [Cytophagales bacterium]
MVKYLQEKGAKIEVADEKGASPLKEAILR